MKELADEIITEIMHAEREDAKQRQRMVNQGIPTMRLDQKVIPMGKGPLKVTSSKRPHI